MAKKGYISNSINTDAAEAAAKAAEEARKARVRMQIAGLELKVQACNGIIQSIQSSRTAMGNHVSNWNGKRSVSRGSQIASEVRIINIYEGLTAEKFAALFPETTGIMDQNASRYYEVNSAASDQIICLQNYIDKLNNEIASLRASIA